MAENGVSKNEFKQFPRDPNAPKRALSAFFIYANEVRESIMDNNPDNTMAENGKIIGEKWSKLSTTGKAKYEKLAEKEKAKYETAVNKYEKTDDYKEYMRIRSEYETEKKSSGKSSTKK